MAHKKKRRIKLNKGKINNKIIVGIVALLVGLPIAAGAALQQTSVRNYASNQSSDAVQNLNTGREITTTLNADGTMGPATYLENYAETQPTAEKGALQFTLASYDAYSYPSYAPSDAPSHPTVTDAHKRGKSGKSNSNKRGNNDRKNGPQSITSLKLTITKAEVHFAYKDSSGPSREHEDNSGKNNNSGKNKGENQGKGKGKNDAQNQGLDKWETLYLLEPTTIDLLDDYSGNPLTKLGVTELTAGKYTQIRLYISYATATLADGETVDLQVLGKDKIVRIIKPFTIEEGKTTTLTLVVDKDRSVIKAGDVYILKPVVAKMDEVQY